MAKGPRPRHVPLRPCVACRQEQAKRDLIRIVRTPAGSIEIDPTGRKAGRGAYLCKRRACWEAALARRALDHALKTTLTEADREMLRQYAATLPESG